jgi:hypothetical protein
VPKLTWTLRRVHRGPIAPGKATPALGARPVAPSRRAEPRAFAGRRGVPTVKPVCHTGRRRGRVGLRGTIRRRATPVKLVGTVHVAFTAGAQTAVFGGAARSTASPLPVSIPIDSSLLPHRNAPPHSSILPVVSASRRGNIAVQMRTGELHHRVRVRERTFHRHQQHQYDAAGPDALPAGAPCGLGTRGRSAAPAAFPGSRLLPPAARHDTGSECSLPVPSP